MLLTLRQLNDTLLLVRASAKIDVSMQGVATDLDSLIKWCIDMKKYTNIFIPDDDLLAKLVNLNNDPDVKDALKELTKRKHT